MGIWSKLIGAFQTCRATPAESKTVDREAIPIENVDSSILANILVNSTDTGTEATKVLDAIKQLMTLWSGENKDIARFLALIPEAYPHLERMADTDYISVEWMKALSEALAAAENNAEKFSKDQEEVSKFLDEFEQLIRDRR